MALLLFERKGFDRVSMEQIASAAAVSRSTLFRLYPSKSDLVWDGLHGIVGEVRRRAAGLAGKRASIAAMVDAILVPILRTLDAPEAARLARRRLRLIAASPALFNHRTLFELQTVLAEIAATMRGLSAPPSLFARTLVAVSFGAVLWWAENDADMRAVDAVRAAFRAAASKAPRSGTVRRRPTVAPPTVARTRRR